MMVFETNFNISKQRPYVVTTYSAKEVNNRIFAKFFVEIKEFHYKSRMDEYIQSLLEKGYTKVY